jgi:hypothetical protein
MAPGWRSGFELGGPWVWAAPVASLSLVAVGQATNADGDIRSGMFPWLMAVASAGLALLGLRLLAVHGPDPSRPVLVGGWWTILAFLGISGFFLAVAVGALLGIDEESAGVLSILPVVSMAFGLLSMTPAVGLLAFGAGRANVLPRWGMLALWTATPMLVVILIYGGLAEGSVETVGVSFLLGVFAISWVVVGVSVRPAAVPPANRTEA